MFLCMDEYGNVYQAASHRADGRGVERLPSVVSESRDNTLDGSFKKNDKKIQDEHKWLRSLNARMDNEQSMALKKKNQQLRNMKEHYALKAEHHISNDNQKNLYKEAMDKKLNGADFDRLSIVDAYYPAKHMAALQYNNEKLGTKPNDVDLIYNPTIVPDSGKLSKELMLEKEADNLRRKTSLTKEFAEYQTIPENIAPVDVRDHAMVTTTQTSVSENVENVEVKKKSKAPLIAGGLALAYLLLG